MAPIHAAQIMEKARGSGQVIEGQLAGEVGVRVKVEASGADEFVSVAFSGLLGARSNDVVAAFDPQQRLTPDWQDELPGEATVPGEIAFTVLRRVDDVAVTDAAFKL